MTKRKADVEFNCETKIVIHSTSINWKIEGFSHRMEKPGEYFQSSEFWSEEDKSIRWCLHLYPNGNTGGEEGYLSLFLIPIVFAHNKQASYRFYLLNIKSEIVKETAKTRIFDKNQGFGFPRWFRTDELIEKGLLLNDTLLIRCEVDLFTFMTIAKTSDKKFKSDHKIDKLITPRDWVSSEPMILTCENKSLYIHKDVLKVMSPVFHAMLTHNMFENNSNQIIMADMSYGALRDLIQYFYSGIVPEFNENAKELSILADKYLIEDLKAKLEQQIIENITSENYLEWLNFSDIYRLKDAKMGILLFIKENFPNLS